MLELGKGAMLSSATMCPATDDTEKVGATKEIAGPAAETKEEASALDDTLGLAAQDIEDDFPVDPAWLSTLISQAGWVRQLTCFTVLGKHSD